MECTLTRIMNVGISLEEAKRVSREISRETMASYDAVVPQLQRPRSGPDIVSYVLGPHTLHPGLKLALLFLWIEHGLQNHGTHMPPGTLTAPWAWERSRRHECLPTTRPVWRRNTAGPLRNLEVLAFHWGRGSGGEGGVEVEISTLKK